MANDSQSTSPDLQDVRFVADARLLSILGEQLIGSEKVGILELVKNSYDAGAAECVVTIEGVPNLEPATRTLPAYESLAGPIVEIRDDGSGMTRDDIVNGWLRPATSTRGRVKERLKKERALAAERGSLEAYDALVDTLRKEHGGRLPLGEKGVGRLATHRLGQHLWLRTKTKDDALEWELRIDWNDFDAMSSERRDLSDVPLTLTHQTPTADYGPQDHGTVLVCYGGREGYEWTKLALTDLAQAIGTLQSPRAKTPFSVAFRTPHLEPAALDNPAKLDAPFELVAIVDEDGLADIDLSFTPPEHLEHVPEGFRRLDHIDLRSKNVQYWKNGSAKLRKPECGQFLVHALCWIRMPKWLGPEFREVTSYLDHFGGLAIYRDGILAQPAQQSARSDWLGLASQQIKKSSKLSYYQLVGEIEIDQTKTLALRDRSSREGMIETEAFNDLTELTKGILSELEIHTRRVRDEWGKKDRTGDVSALSAGAASRSSSRLFRALAESYDFAKDPLRLRSVDPALRSAKRARAIADAMKALPDFLSLREEERNGLVEAAGFGLAVAVGVHEIARVASAISSECRWLVKHQGSEELPNRLRHAAARADSLLSEVKRIAPLRTTRTEPVQTVSMRKAAEAARMAFATSLDDSKIALRIEGEDFTVGGRFGALSQVFANLIDNSIYWLSTVEGKRDIRVTLFSESRSVLFADSGPGIADKMHGVLFEPFYSEKSPPSGLGLYVCKYYLSQLRATIRLAKASERSDLAGAQFMLGFAKSPEGHR